MTYSTSNDGIRLGETKVCDFWTVDREGAAELVRLANIGIKSEQRRKAMEALAEIDADEIECGLTAEETAQGWKTWNGGKCPVDPDTRVEVRLRNGLDDIAPAGCWDWDHYCGDCEIVAYRVIGGDDE